MGRTIDRQTIKLKLQVSFTPTQDRRSRQHFFAYYALHLPSISPFTSANITSQVNLSSFLSTIIHAAAAVSLSARCFLPAHRITVCDVNHHTWPLDAADDVRLLGSRIERDGDRRKACHAGDVVSLTMEDLDVLKLWYWIRMNDTILTLVPINGPISDVILVLQAKFHQLIVNNTQSGLPSIFNGGLGEDVMLVLAMWNYMRKETAFLASLGALQIEFIPTQLPTHISRITSSSTPHTAFSPCHSFGVKRSTDIPNTMIWDWSVTGR
ncbi:hypothetical protein M422DRAFT_241189 [Sphaerobolus stellatus SS14]|nr:hypothetical protein M422DRAFT_241189 [Sphaerobolus stellatus SS14]